MRGRIDPLKPVKRARVGEGDYQTDLSIKARLKQAIQEQEQTIVRLVDERRLQVKRIEDQIQDMQAQLIEAKKKLMDAEAQLRNLRDRSPLSAVCEGAAAKPCEKKPVRVKVEPGDLGTTNCGRKPVLVVPGSRLNGSFDVGDLRTIGNTPDSKSAVSNSSHLDPGVVHVKSDSGSSSEINPPKVMSGPSSKQHKDLVSCVAGSMASSSLNVLGHHYFPSQHKRKLRSLLAVNRTSDNAFATSALDGMVNIWKVKDKGEGILLVGSAHCLSSGQKRWPEDLAWHPSGQSIFACYSADAKDDQVAIINLSSSEKARFLKYKPHEKGIVNSLVFLPWKERTLFITAGCDHGVVLWKEERDHDWEPQVLHRSLHSSAVMAAVGMQQRPVIVSVGMDKRIIGFDTHHMREEFRYTLDSKALGMVPNPVDMNLYMVQTGTPGQQLRLFDYRSQRNELHALGWRQEATESQSALIDQSWSPDGLYIASGSADPKIHIFDIRYSSKEPLRSIKAHQKRVFKAVWHHTLPLLISISSDLNIGLLKFSM